MIRKKAFIITGLIALLVFCVCIGSVWAGGNEDPPTTGQIVGPELWGVMVYDCGLNALVLRVKRVVDCNVQTQAFLNLAYSGGCPTDASSIAYRQLGISLFDINPNPAVMDPIITKVKNFKQEGTSSLYSFDVQIKFWTP